MRFEWDQARARSNLRKHGVDFADAAVMLEDFNALTSEDISAIGERRFATIGMDAEGQVLVVVYTYRENCIRLISARPATHVERKAYEEGIRLQ